MPTLPRGLRPDSHVARLWTAQSGHCFHCGLPMHAYRTQDGLRWSREHIYPRSIYGRGVIVLAHRSCNSVRGDR